MIAFLGALTVLSACVPLQDLQNGQMGGWSSSASSTTSVSSSASSDQIEFAVEIEEEPSSSVVSGTGALAQRMGDNGVLEIGDAAAPLALTVFTNYSCDYCSEFFNDMLPQLESDFVRTGNLKLQIVVTPLKKYPNSPLEASALLCGTALGKGAEMHAALLPVTLHDRKSILALAKKLALPTKDFTSCLSAKETKALLTRQQEMTAAQGVTLIPTFILNGEKRVGLPSSADMRGWVQENVSR